MKVLLGGEGIFDSIHFGLLEKKKHTIMHITDPGNILNQVKHGNPDQVILSSELPSFITIFSEIRKVLPLLPVHVVTTRDNFQTIVAEVKHYGFYCFFMKKSIPYGEINRVLANPKRKLLVVDDDEPVHEIIEYALKKDGFVIKHSYKGRSGLVDVMQLVPDIMLLDINMPDIDGISLLSELKKENMTHIPIIMFTSLSEQSIVEECIALGADRYILKPVDKDGLVKRIYDLLAQYETERLRLLVRYDDFPVDDRSGKSGEELLLVEKAERRELPVAPAVWISDPRGVKEKTEEDKPGEGPGVIESSSDEIELDEEESTGPSEIPETDSIIVVHEKEREAESSPALLPAKDERGSRTGMEKIMVIGTQNTPHRRGTIEDVAVDYLEEHEIDVLFYPDVASSINDLSTGSADLVIFDLSLENAFQQYNSLQETLKRNGTTVPTAFVFPSPFKRRFIPGLQGKVFEQVFERKLKAFDFNRSLSGENDEELENYYVVRDCGRNDLYYFLRNASEEDMAPLKKHLEDNEQATLDQVVKELNTDKFSKLLLRMQNATANTILTAFRQLLDDLAIELKQYDMCGVYMQPVSIMEIKDLGKNPRTRVLIIDDEQDVHEIHSFALEREGYEVASAMTKEEGLEQLERFEPHLVLLDNDLGSDTKGVDLIPALKEKAPDVVITMLTGDPTQELKTLVFSRGGSGFLSKTCKTEEKLEHLREKLAEYFLNRTYCELKKKTLPPSGRVIGLISDKISSYYQQVMREFHLSLIDSNKCSDIDDKIKQLKQIRPELLIIDEEKTDGIEVTQRLKEMEHHLRDERLKTMKVFFVAAPHMDECLEDMLKEEENGYNVEGVIPREQASTVLIRHIKEAFS